MNETHWHAGCNTPGYLPDSPPLRFSTFSEAAQWVSNELLTLAQDEEDDADLANELYMWAGRLLWWKAREWAHTFVSSVHEHDLGTAWFIDACPAPTNS